MGRDLRLKDDEIFFMKTRLVCENKSMIFVPWKYSCTSNLIIEKSGSYIGRTIPSGKDEVVNCVREIYGDYFGNMCFVSNYWFKRQFRGVGLHGERYRIVEKGVSKGEIRSFRRIVSNV